MFKYQRIMIIGPGGAGKSTFSKQLAKILNYPIYHLDTIYWLPNWEHLEKNDFIEKVNEIIMTPQWIIDGTYSGTLDQRLEKADLVIFLDINRVKCLYSVTKRRIKHRNLIRSDITIGCKEKLDWNFLKWVWDFPKKNKPTMLQKVSEYPNVHLLVFKSRKEAYNFLNNLTK